MLVGLVAMVVSSALMLAIPDALALVLGLLLLDDEDDGPNPNPGRKK